MAEILDLSFNAFVLRMAERFMWEPCEGYTTSFESMKDDVATTGILRVNTEFSEGTIFGEPRVNWAFRAWHDMCHIRMNADFTAEGERAACDEMIRETYAYLGQTNPQATWFARILDAEVNGQVEYYMAHNDFPPDQFQFTVSYLARGIRNPLPHIKRCEACLTHGHENAHCPKLGRSL